MGAGTYRVNLGGATSSQARSRADFLEKGILKEGENKKKGTIVPYLPLWGLCHVIVSLIMGGFAGKR